LFFPISNSLTKPFWWVQTVFFKMNAKFLRVQGAHAPRVQCVLAAHS
jgi:hypothetical protein